MKTIYDILIRLKPEADLLKCENLIDAGVLDSVDIVSIVSAIEEEYEFEIDPDDIDPDNFQSAEHIYKMVQKYIGDDLK